MATIYTLCFVVFAVGAVQGAGGMFSPKGGIKSDLLGGLQTKLTSSVIPIGNLIKTVKQNVNNTAGKYAKRLGQIGAEYSKSWSKTFSRNFSFEIDHIKINELLSTAASFLDSAVKQGMIVPQEAASVASAIVKSALNRRLNPVALLIDVVDKGVQKILLVKKQALTLVVEAVKGGYHLAKVATKTFLKNFLDTAVKAGIISKDVAEKLTSMKSEDKNKSEPEKNTEAEKKARMQSESKEKTDADEEDKEDSQSEDEDDPGTKEKPKSEAEDEPKS